MSLRELKGKKKIVILTGYDFYSAKLISRANFDAILVGDSLGMTIQGMENTHNVTLNEMIYHTKAVKKGAAADIKIITDMPKGSYENESIALESALFLIEAGADLLKIEGFRPDIFSLFNKEKIRVVAHLGLTPQLFNNFKVQGRNPEKAEEIFENAIALDKFKPEALVLECIPLELARRITSAISTPTIGIGAGRFCDGQVLVFHDMLGFDKSFNPKFLKKYANLEEIILGALKAYKNEVEEGSFPSEELSYE